MIIGFENLSEIRQNHPTESFVLAGGVFDLIHPGHIELFEIMDSEADLSIVAVATDKSVRQRKGQTRPIQDQSSRLKVVSAIGQVDYALVAPEPNQMINVPMLPILEELRPDKYISSDPRWKNSGILKSLGVELISGSKISEEMSTTAMIDRIRLGC